MRLGVNIDHVATVRNARRTFEPDPVYAAIIAQIAGADQITLHVREDRRHVNEEDLRRLKELLHIPINLEMAPTKEMKEIALKVKPNRITLVPEKREELTTEGGLDVASQLPRMKEVCSQLEDNNIRVSLFIDADKKQIDAAMTCGAPVIEIHTGHYADASDPAERELKYNEIKKDDK